jgi:lipopolysaccharide/colanic/teichoic acid biosynthesis glycosyltransferase
MSQLFKTNSIYTKRQGAAELRPLPGWKRGLDIFCCCLALPFLAICTFAVAILMSIAAPGPIFFRQERVGYMGRRFRLFKFRTMHVGAETSGHQAHFAELVSTNAPMLKLDAKGDSRLIPLGWLIRASGFDELPQIINILRGDMSIVGPRPCIPYEYENYSALQRRRFHCVPGLTGLWQVSGKNRTTFDRMIQLDIQYVSEKSLGLDLKILALTIPAVLGQVADMCRLRRKSPVVTAPVGQPMSAPSAVHLTKEPSVISIRTS